MTFVGQDRRVFDENWRARAMGGALGDSWANEVVATRDGDGGRYLATLVLWFERFPFPSRKDRREFKTRLESFITSDHLGAVNELSWYEFMRQADFQLTPVSPTTAPRPDFRITAPVNAFVEVSTLNVSEGEQKAFQATGGVDLNPHETLRRLLFKASHEKSDQLQYAATQALPCLLVLFDYTFWSGLATNFYRYLATALLAAESAFARLPSALSGIVYVERKIFGGHIRLSRRRSAIYYNPRARYSLTPGAFDMLRQFRHNIVETEPSQESDWIELCQPSGTETRSGCFEGE